MAGNLQPLVNNQRIVKADGTPTDYFIRWAQQKQIDIGSGITAEQALQIITQYLADHELQAGSGIQITPSGNLSDTPTIAAEVQAILDQITDVHGSILFRGASDWEALAPGINGYFLRTNGAGNNPSWAAGGGGGGGGTVIAEGVLPSNLALGAYFLVPIPDEGYYDFYMDLPAGNVNPHFTLNSATTPANFTGRVKRWGTAGDSTSGTTAFLTLFASTNLGSALAQLNMKFHKQPDNGRWYFQGTIMNNSVVSIFSAISNVFSGTSFDFGSSNTNGLLAGTYYKLIRTDA